MIQDPFAAPLDRSVSLRHPNASATDAPRRAPTYLTFDEFLVREELFQLTKFTLDHEADFAQTTVRRGGVRRSVINGNYRRSRAIFNLGPHYEMFAVRLQTFLPYVFDRLAHKPFHVTRIEAQITASNDGDFYRPHRDDAHDAWRSRAITFVFYFYREPKAFTGGELRIADDAGSTANIVPRQDQLVLFPSCFLHEILPVSCPSRRFADGRFALNGWIHR